MFNQVGNCPKCGAPIYVESPWFSVEPPPNKFTCACRFAGQSSISYVHTDSTTADSRYFMHGGQSTTVDRYFMRGGKK